MTFSDFKINIKRTRTVSSKSTMKTIKQVCNKNAKTKSITKTLTKFKHKQSMTANPTIRLQN